MVFVRTPVQLGPILYDTQAWNRSREKFFLLKLAWNSDLIIILVLDVEQFKQQNNNENKPFEYKWDQGKTPIRSWVYSISLNRIRN